MAIAVVINDDGIVTPIVEGTVLRIINQDQTVEDYRNPALDLTEGRRGAALRKAIEKGVRTFVAPPATFCELSYQKAQEQQIAFITIEPNQPFAEVAQALRAGTIQKTKQLPSAHVVPSAPVFV